MTYTTWIPKVGDHVKVEISVFLNGSFVARKNRFPGIVRHVIQTTDTGFYVNADFEDIVRTIHAWFRVEESPPGEYNWFVQVDEGPDNGVHVEVSRVELI